MQDIENPKPHWVSRGKTINQLIKELQSFENQELEVKISIDSETFKSISLVTRQNKEGIYFCGLENCE